MAMPTAGKLCRSLEALFRDKHTHTPNFISFLLPPSPTGVRSSTASQTRSVYTLRPSVLRVLLAISDLSFVDRRAIVLAILSRCHCLFYPPQAVRAHVALPNSCAVSTLLGPLVLWVLLAISDLSVLERRAIALSILSVAVVIFIVISVLPCVLHVLLLDLCKSILHFSLSSH